MTRQYKKNAFTLLEVMAALAVSAIALTAFLNLQLGTIALCNKAEIIMQATQLAQSKIAETRARGFVPPETNSGIYKHQGQTLNWQVTVSDTPETRHTGIRNISVIISWNSGMGRRSLVMESTLINRALP